MLRIRSIRTSAALTQMPEQIHKVVMLAPQILKGSESTGTVRLVKNKPVPSIVMIRGAVSPAILGIAKIIAVSIALFALFRTINSVIFLCGIPNE